MRLDPTYEQPYLQRGAVYSKNGEWDKAIADYNSSLALEAGYPAVWYNCGCAYAH